MQGVESPRWRGGGGVSGMEDDWEGSPMRFSNNKRLRIAVFHHLSVVIKAGVMRRPGELIDGIQKRRMTIETEAARLMVFANSTSDAALGSRFKKIAKVMFRNAREM